MMMIQQLHRHPLHHIVPPLLSVIMTHQAHGQPQVQIYSLNSSTRMFYNQGPPVTPILPRLALHSPLTHLNLEDRRQNLKVLSF